MRVPRALLALVAVLPLGRASLLKSPGQNRYSTNAVCRRQYCINPIFPALNKLGTSVMKEQKQRTYQCVKDHQAWKLAGFCKHVAIEYPFATPQPEGNALLSDVMRAEQEQAMAMYGAHLSGMGLDVWEWLKPWETNDECIRSVWKMVCYTYFPRCNEVDETQYLKPCKNSCQSYINACGVTCCDEGVQCVYDHTELLANGVRREEEGYADHAGPSPLCTGGAPPRAGLGALAALALPLALVLAQAVTH